ncbi:ATP-binding protein [Herminiimonas sp. CN]|uniref:ATP-binding protein n=1 Tax=Herminiimonas sp. CN TaxID=1349818 RepID=UPI000473911E|nr:ATP-binding protein [Herminiimonas sp. CN]
MSHIANIELHSPPLTKSAVCETHGDYESRCYLGKIWTACPACADDQSKKERTEAEAKEQAARVESWRRKIGEAGIPERFRDRRISTYAATLPGQQRALDFAKAYAAQFGEIRKTGRSALFIGLPGTGKTHLAVGIGLEVMEHHGAAVLFTTVMRAVRRVKDTWGRGSRESESEAIAALVFPDLLILDEVGVQFGSDTEKLLLFDILNERYEKRRPTILMSNLPIDEVVTYLGARVFDRLREGGGEFISFTWESYRKTGTHGAEGI